MAEQEVDHVWEVYETGNSMDSHECVSPRYISAHVKAYRSMENYLLEHEGDIARGVNDFGDLSDFFNLVLMRSPSEDG